MGRRYRPASVTPSGEVAERSYGVREAEFCYSWLGYQTLLLKKMLVTEQLL